MGAISRSWWRSWWATAAGYLAVGIASIPAGLAYGVALAAGWDHWVVTVACLAAGLVLGRLGWVATARLFPQPRRDTHAEAASGKPFVRVEPSPMIRACQEWPTTSLGEPRIPKENARTVYVRPFEVARGGSVRQRHNTEPCPAGELAV